MAANTKLLKEAGGGAYAPQHYNASIDDYEYTQGADGSAFVTIKKRRTTFVFADNTNAAGSNTYSYADEEYVTIEVYGSGSEVTANFSANLVIGSRKYPAQGIKLTGIVEVFSGPIKPGCIVRFIKPADTSLELAWDVPVGGYVSAKATVETKL